MLSLDSILLMMVQSTPHRAWADGVRWVALTKLEADEPWAVEESGESLKVQARLGVVGGGWWMADGQGR